MAALASMCVHAAVLVLPLGFAAGERAFRPMLGGMPLKVALAPPEARAIVAAVPRAPNEGANRAHQPKRPQPVGNATEASGIRPPAAVYFAAAQLTEQAHPLAPLPLDLLRRVVVRPGSAELTLLIDEAGQVAGVEVKSATLPPAAITRAEEVLRSASFAPGRIGDAAVKSRLGITIRIEDQIAAN